MQPQFSYLIGKNLKDGQNYAKQNFINQFGTNRYFEHTNVPNCIRQIKILDHWYHLRHIEPKAIVYLTPNTQQSEHWEEMLTLIRKKNAIISII